MDVYLDNAATSWPKPEEVYRAVDHFMRTIGATPGRGGHRREDEAQQTADETRTALAQLFHAPASTGVAFTMNATQAINMALKGLLRPGDHVITSSIEHHALWRPLKALEQRGVEVTAVPCAPDGTLDPVDVEATLRPHTRLIVLLHASNVLGTILPIAEMGEIAQRHGVLLLVDAAQTAGASPIDMQAMGIDLLAFAGHKGTYGPHGTGGLVVRPGVELQTWVEGGSGVLSRPDAMPEELPTRLEAGTQNAAGLAGLLAGVQFVLAQGVETIRAHEMALAGRLIVVSSGRVLKESIHILAEGMPKGMTATTIAQAMLKVAGVEEVHDLHVWTVAPGYIALSAHVTVDDQAISQTAEIMSALKETLHNSFEIHHTTIQFECGNCGQGTVLCTPEALAW